MTKSRRMPLTAQQSDGTATVLGGHIPSHVMNTKRTLPNAGSVFSATSDHGLQFAISGRLLKLGIGSFERKLVSSKALAELSVWHLISPSNIEANLRAEQVAKIRGIGIPSHSWMLLQ